MKRFSNAGPMDEDPKNGRYVRQIDAYLAARNAFYEGVRWVLKDAFDEEVVHAAWNASEAAKQLEDER